MSSIVIGHNDQNKSVALDLDILIRTRLLVQANSGGGKSWLLRRFAEETFGKVPLIIIDPEGEFATLREKFGFDSIQAGSSVLLEKSGSQMNTDTTDPHGFSKKFSSGNRGL